ncbi:MAG: TolC family protein, partial [Proteobacteria bacterium]|nr:TolC family protein [Pseudomonadota bacterium]
MKNNITLTSLCQPIVISALLFSPQLTFAQTLTEAIEQTIKTNPEVLEEAYRKLASDSTIAQAQAGYYPKIDLAVGTGWESTDSPTTRANGSHKNKHLNRDEASLNLSQMLFDGFAVKSQVDRSQSLVESAAYQVANSSERLSLRAINVYLATLQDRELLEITQGNFDAHEQTHDQITLRSESGVGSKADIDQSQGRLSLAQANLLAAHGNLEDSQSNFQRVIGNL